MLGDYFTQKKGQTVPRVGNGLSFQKKFRGIDSKRFPLFLGRNCSFWDIPRSNEESIPKLGTEWYVNTQKKLVLRNSQNNFRKLFSELFSLPRNWFGTEFREFASIFDARNGILSIFLFHGTVRNRIPRNCFYFCCTAQNFEHFSLPRNGLERNSETYLFRGTAGIPPEQTNCSVYSVFR